MSHSCPECGQCCHCNGDIEDHETGEDEGCTHCPADGISDEEDSPIQDPLEIPAFLRRTTENRTMTAENKRTAEYTPTPEEAEKMRQEIVASMTPSGGPDLTPEKIMDMIRELNIKMELITTTANSNKAEIKKTISALKAQAKKMIGDL